MTQSIELIGEYKINQFSKDTDNMVKRLCDKCSDYYILSGGSLPTKEDIKAIFTDLPSNKDIKDKFVLGVYKSNELVGIIDIIRGYPTIREWTIGLLLLEPEERGKGLGFVIHEALVNWAKDLGAKQFTVGVIQDNYRALKFWNSLGYKKIKEVRMDIVSKTQIVNLMMLEI